MKELALVVLVVVIACLGVGGAGYIVDEVWAWDDWQDYNRRSPIVITFEAYKKLKQGGVKQ